MRLIRLLGLLVVTASLVHFSGCTESEDLVLKPGETNFSIDIRQLPTAPPGMIYELWVSTRPVVDTSAPTSAVKSLLKFNYRYNANGPYFADVDGNEISTEQILPVDIFDYSSVFVSVEQVNDPDPLRPANILFASTLVSIADQVFTLRVPGAADLGTSLVRYNMEAVSDNDRNLNDGAGIWFANYVGVTDTIPDTIAITNISYTLDTILPDTVGGVIVNLDELTKAYPFSVDNIRPETTFYDFGPDSLISGVSRFRHIGMRYDLTYQRDTVGPIYTKRNFIITYQTVSTPTAPFVRLLETFTQDAVNLPNLSRFGLKWKGWVLAPTTVLNSTALGNFTPPVWPTSGVGFNWIAPTDGRLLPIARFGEITSDDEDGNPYTFRLFRGTSCPTCTDSTYKIPDKPGEDLLNNTALSTAYPGLSAPLNLLPQNTGNVGTVMITLEPINNPNPSTNFPLIAHFAPLPANRNSIATNSYSLSMQNASGTTTGNTFGPGFPLIKLAFRRL